MNNPYIDPMKPQDLSGIAPTYQNIMGQQAMQNAALAQQSQLAQQAGQASRQDPNGIMALALALRKGKKDETNPKKPAPITDYSEEI